MKKRNKKNLKIGLGITGMILIAILFSFAISQTIYSYDYTKTVTFGEWNAIVYSTENFGVVQQNSINPHSNDCILYSYTDYISPDDSFSIYQNNYGTTCRRVSSNMNPTNGNMYLQTTNLNFSTSNFKKLDIIFQAKNNIQCYDSSTSGQGSGQNAQINLVSNSNTINIYSGSGVQSYFNPSSEDSGQITITRSEGDYLINRLGNTELIEIPRGEYELQIYSTSRGCTSGIESSPIETKITRLILEKEEGIIEDEEIDEEDITPGEIGEEKFDYKFLLIIIPISILILISFIFYNLIKNKRRKK